MREFTLEQYKELSKRFNAMSFSKKIITIKDNRDILTLASDHNWWGVKVKDEKIQEQLEVSHSVFQIQKEWDDQEMNILICLLGIDNTDI